MVNRTKDWKPIDWGDLPKQLAASVKPQMDKLAKALFDEDGTNSGKDTHAGDLFVDVTELVNAGKLALVNWSLWSDHPQKIEAFDALSSAVAKCEAHEHTAKISEALDLLSAVTQSDGKVNDLLWNQIQAALKKWGES